MAYICKECGGRCVEDVAPKVDEEAQIMVADENFWQQLPRIFVYPFKGNGPYLLLGGTVFFTILNLMMGVLFIGFLLGPFLFFYTTACLVNILRASIVPYSDEPPEWPDGTLWKDWIGTSLLLVAAGLLCYAPALFYFTQVKENDLIYWLLIILGTYFFPMCFLSVALNENLYSLNLINIFFSIIRTIVPYTSLVIFWLILFSFNSWVEAVILGHVPFLGYILEGFLFVYSLFISMRPLGLFYRVNRDKLLGFSD
ncbi:MAG: hypothetical protein H6753_02945 [Candidatus Omnitrophica bacterium]|nr:hypothetical protein [Candidatus Omnitrophota bacterium]